MQVMLLFYISIYIRACSMLSFFNNNNKGISYSLLTQDRT